MIDKQKIVSKYIELKSNNSLYTQKYLNEEKMKYFKDNFSISSLKKMKSDKVLETLFMKVNTRNSFAYHIESGLYKPSNNYGTFGSMQAPLRNTEKDGWRTKINGTNSWKNLTLQEATDEACSIRNYIFEIDKKIQEFIKKTRDYNFIISIFNEIKENKKYGYAYMYFRKYFFLQYPNIFTSWISYNLPNDKIISFLNLDKDSNSLEMDKKIYNEFRDYNINDIYSIILDLCADNSDLKKKKSETEDSSMLKNNLNIQQKKEENKNRDIPLNQILYGPPGTGKTYNTIIEAMKIFDKDIIKYDNNGNCKNYSDVKDKFDKLKDEGQIQFVTFHQSYSYEEFIEGIKPKTENEQITYEVQDGIFKKMCDNAQKQVIDNFDEVYEQFINEVIEYEDENSKPFTLKTSKNRIFGMRVNSNNNLTLLMGENLSPYGTLTKENLKNLADWKYYASPIKEYLTKKYDLKYKQIENSNDKPYVLIIDEINRGNISKIFGELITLIEDDKRLGNDNKLMVQLPYSQKPFGVPKNLYIIGTMNTSDRSIALLDTALRRRFDFIEMPPKPELLKDKKVEGVNINFEKLLNEINSQIDDKDRKIGHSYLINIENENDLKRAFKNKIIPLLEEYYYNDKEQINSILTCGDEIKKAMEIVNK